MSLCVLLLCLSALARQATTFSDAFGGDTSLNPAIWTTHSTLLKTIARNSASIWIEPRLSFSDAGMTFSGVTGTFQFSGIQSVASFHPPFDASARVTGTMANGNPFVFYVSDASQTRYVSIAGNLNPRNTGYYGINIDGIGRNRYKLYQTPSNRRGLHGFD
jgi:hypothetical protein